MSIMSIDRRVLQLDSRAAALLYTAVALAVVASAVLIALSWLLSEVVYRVFLVHQRLDNVLPLLAFMSILLLLRAALLWYGEVVSQRAAGRVKEAARSRLGAKLFALGPAHTRRERSGELVNTLVDGVETLDDYVREYQQARLVAGLVPMLVLLVVLVLDPWSAVVLLFAGPMLVLLLAVIGAQTHDLSKRRFLELSWMSAHFLDMVQGLATLKMLGRSKEQAENIEDISRQFAGSTMQVLRSAFQISLMLEWAAVGATAFVALEVSLRLIHGLLPLDTALTVLLLTPEFFVPMRQLALKYHAGTAGKAAAERIFELLDTEAPPAATPVTSPATLVKTGEPRRSDIHFEDVRFTYPGRSQPVLTGITLTIPHSQSTALVGATGAGKTTLASLLLRFTMPTSGSIRLGEAPLDTLDLGICRQLMAWVPQHPHFFHGTIGENIRLARPDAGPEAVVAAARAAHAHEFIQALPRGYETPIYEGGTRLSGGQRQRIAIARAFLKDAPILILDEATAHLDAESEAAIQDSLMRLVRDRTTLIIAHRLQMAFGANQIAVIDQGRVVEVGTHLALLRASELYRTLVARYQETVA